MACIPFYSPFSRLSFPSCDDNKDVEGQRDWGVENVRDANIDIQSTARDTARFDKNLNMAKYEWC